jgi:DtxR family Mn-dependent transcriptional regulator
MLSGKQNRSGGLTPSHEHYLRAIWEVRSRHGYARLTDVARELGVSHPTLSVGLQPLERQRLIAHDENRFLVLTERGERVAREVHHRYRVLQVFLVDFLGIERAKAEREACLLEHHVSEETTDRLLDVLKLMQVDPALRRTLLGRLAAFHRECQTKDSCATCDLACMAGVNPPA